MKKILVICLMTVMILSVSVSVLAASNGFVSSPSGNSAPTVEDFDAADEDCTASLLIVAYGDRNELPDTLRTMFENAYSQIASSNDLTTLNADLAALVSGMNIEGENLAVSDLFDIHVTDCDFHEGHVDFDVTLSADTLKNFVALLHMNKNGEWELVSDARVTNNGEHLEFSVDSFSPFAIVVDASQGSPVPPPTGDNSIFYIYAIVMSVCAVAVVVIAVKSKKQRA